MSDRELLELAARAAGLDGEYARIHQTYGDEWIDGINAGSPILWNPLADDGDALRLAVKLGFLVSQQLSYVSVCQPHGNASMRGIQFQEPYGTDPIAATRRAIVRAAAEIAKAREA
ncbi:hypothetical protein [Burkholderia cenocepacia]